MYGYLAFGLVWALGGYIYTKQTKKVICLSDGSAKNIEFWFGKGLQAEIVYYQK